MKKIINSVEYDTDLSMLVCMPGGPVNVGVYRHANNGLFLTISGVGDVLFPLTEAQAEPVINSGVFDIDGGV